MTRIDRESSLTSTERWRLRIHEWIAKIRAIFQSTPSPIRWALAAQTGGDCPDSDGDHVDMDSLSITIFNAF